MSLLSCSQLQLSVSQGEAAAYMPIASELWIYCNYQRGSQKLVLVQPLHSSVYCSNVGWKN